MVNKKMQRCGLILLALPLVACAEVFQWTDQQGQQHYSDQAGDNAKKMAKRRPSLITLLIRCLMAIRFC
jgi:hypothetical protein